MADRVRSSPEAKLVAGAPSRLRSYCHGRLLDGYLGGQVTSIEEILQDAVELGDEELACQARPYLASRVERVGGELEGPEVHVGKV
eukprot:7465292-Pyramimonas_sp.AAC.1